MTVTGMVTTIFSYSDTDSGRDEASFWKFYEMSFRLHYSGYKSQWSWGWREDIRCFVGGQLMTGLC